MSFFNNLDLFGIFFCLICEPRSVYKYILMCLMFVFWQESIEYMDLLINWKFFNSFIYLMHF